MLFRSTFFFAPGPVTSWQTAKVCRTDLYARFFWGLIERGVYFPCSQFEALFLSAKHSDADIQHTVQAAREVFESLKAS